MKQDQNIRPHGTGVRGVNLSRSSVLFGGPFGRIFRALPPADFGKDDAASVAALNVLGTALTADSEEVKEGPDPEESGIPAAYTYFGQFIDHDLTFDPASSLQKQNDPDALVDYRTPRFDLDNVYGRGPDDQPYLYDDKKFVLGRPLTGAAANTRATDLPRLGAGQRAVIGDPRNDENVIVSQLQGIFHRFHNYLVDLDPTGQFEDVQRAARWHYQWAVLNDFLPTILSTDVIAEVLPHVANGTDILRDPPRLRYFRFRDEPFMPLEFSAAAYRFGHSMVRPGYRLSETVGMLPIFDPVPDAGLTGFRKFPDDWAIDWNLFIDLEPRDPKDSTRTQLAYRIDTSLVSPLGNLPPSIGMNPSVLAQRNLLRAWRMRLPSGQSVARAMGLDPQPDDGIAIGKATGDAGDIRGKITDFDSGFRDNCPLWVYVLAETVEEQMPVRTKGGTIYAKTRKLGPVGGRIVAETFAGILLGDSSSYLSQNPKWKPSVTAGGQFGLRELIAAALS